MELGGNSEGSRAVALLERSCSAQWVWTQPPVWIPPGCQFCRSGECLNHSVVCVGDSLSLPRSKAGSLCQLPADEGLFLCPLLQKPGPGKGQHRNQPQRSSPCCSPSQQPQRWCLCRDQPESFDSFSELFSIFRGGALPPAAGRTEGIASSKAHSVQDCGSACGFQYWHAL